MRLARWLFGELTPNNANRQRETGPFKRMKAEPRLDRKDRARTAGTEALCVSILFIGRWPWIRGEAESMPHQSGSVCRKTLQSTRYLELAWGMPAANPFRQDTHGARPPIYSDDT